MATRSQELAESDKAVFEIGKSYCQENLQHLTRNIKERF